MGTKKVACENPTNAAEKPMRVGNAKRPSGGLFHFMKGPLAFAL
jgi:hypothetical protein